MYRFRIGASTCKPRKPIVFVTDEKVAGVGRHYSRKRKDKHWKKIHLYVSSC